MMTNEKEKNVVYFIPWLFKFTGDAETAIALAAKDIKEYNNAHEQEIISDPVAFITNHGYIVKCIRANGRDFTRTILMFDNNQDTIPFDGIMLQAQKN